MRKRKSRDQLRFNRRQFVVLSSFALIVMSSAIGLTSFSAWAVCSYSGTRNQEGSLKHDGSNLYRCDSSNTWENLGALSAADNLGNHTATQNLILGSYYLSGDGGNEGIYVDASGNVGIGTTSPVYKLEVNAGRIIGVQNAEPYGLGLKYNFTTNGIWLGGTSDQALAFSGWGGNELMRLTQTGNVGIGTASPSTKFHVNGNAIFNGDLSLNKGASSVAYIYFDDQFSLAKNGVGEKLRIDSSGNVGIGTTSPGYKLQIQNSSGSTTNTLFANNDWVYNSTGSGLLAFSGASTGNTTWNMQTYTAGATAYGDLNFQPSGGNVGIGTSTPSGKLHVSGTGTTAIHLEGASSGYYNAGIVLRSTSDTNTRGSGIFMHDAGADNEWFAGRPYSTSDKYIIARKTGMASHDGGSTAQNINALVAVTSSGTVGIGTSAPGYMLDVYGGDINASGSVRSAGIALTSDIRYKRDIEPIQNALDKIQNIRGVSYNWRTEEFPQKRFNRRHQMGVIAQEIEVEFPEAVDTTVDGYKSVNYPALVAPLIEATKTLAKRVSQIEVDQTDQARAINSVQERKSDLSTIEALKLQIEVLRARSKKFEQDNLAKSKELKNLRSRLEALEKLVIEK